MNPEKSQHSALSDLAREINFPGVLPSSPGVELRLAGGQETIVELPDHAVQHVQAATHLITETRRQD